MLFLQYHIQRCLKRCLFRGDHRVELTSPKQDIDHFTKKKLARKLDLPTLVISDGKEGGEIQRCILFPFLLLSLLPFLIYSLPLFPLFILHLCIKNRLNVL